MTRCVTLFLLCHPEAKPKGLLRRFFAIAYSEKDEILHSANAPFRMTKKGGSDAVLSRSEGMTKKKGQNDKKGGSE